VAFLLSEGSNESNQTVNGRETIRCSQSAKLILNEAWWVASLEPRKGFDIPAFLEKQWNKNFQIGVTDPGVIVRTLWELIPWSWLIDYFSNLGSLIQYHSNAVVYDVPAISLMAQYKLRRTISPAYWNSSGNAKNWGNVTNGFTVKTWKRRQIHLHPGMGLALDPFLTGTQIANLLALASSFQRLDRRMKAAAAAAARAGYGLPDDGGMPE
jgi:hypothetical protein